MAANAMQTQSPEFDQLKDLLLKDEHHTLQRLEAVVQQHQQRVGDSNALRNSVSEIVCDALRDAAAEMGGYDLSDTGTVRWNA